MRTAGYERIVGIGDDIHRSQRVSGRFGIEKAGASVGRRSGVRARCGHDTGFIQQRCHVTRDKRADLGPAVAGVGEPEDALDIIMYSAPSRAAPATVKSRQRYIRQEVHCRIDCQQQNEGHDEGEFDQRLTGPLLTDAAVRQGPIPPGGLSGKPENPTLRSSLLRCTGSRGPRTVIAMSHHAAINGRWIPQAVVRRRPRRSSAGSETPRE